MWKEDKDLSDGSLYWTNFYVQSDFFSADGSVFVNEDGGFTAKVFVETDGAESHVLFEGGPFETVEQAQKWCDDKWNAPENLTVRLQYAQLVNLWEINQSLEELLKLTKARW